MTPPQVHLAPLPPLPTNDTVGAVVQQGVHTAEQGTAAASAALLGIPGLRELLPHLGLGFILGVAAGYTVKLAGKVALLTLGVIFIGVQLLAAGGYATVDWDRLQRQTDPWLAQQAQPWLEHLWAVFLHNLPVGGSFVAGFVLGLRR